MEKEKFKQEFKTKLQKLSLNLSEQQIEQFYKYMELLLEWNEKMNLTAITELNEIILKHFIDSLTICSYIKNEDKILDIGTGAGFPGIPIKIVKTENQITLLDSLNKRIIFLNEVIEKLNLTNIFAIHGRAEEIIKKKKINDENSTTTNLRESYNIVVSRAVAKLNILLEYMLPFTKVGGKCICMKSCNIEEEVNEAQKAIKILGGEIDKIDKIVLPDSDIKRTIIVIKKIKETPKQFPRKAGTPTKQPII